MLAGPWRAAVALRREIAPVLNQRQEVAWGTAGILYLLLVLWGPTHALRTWWGILLIGALLALGIYLLRKQTLEEFPNAGLEGPEHSLGARMAVTARKVTDRSGKPRQGRRGRAGPLDRRGDRKARRPQGEGRDHRRGVRAGQEARPRLEAVLDLDAAVLLGGRE